MTMSTVTNETIAGVADLKAGYTLGNADVAILKALAAELLAVREAQSLVPEMTIEKAVDIVWNDPGIDIDSPGAVYLAGWSARHIAPPAPAVQSDDINLLDMKPQEWFEALGKSPLMCAGLGVDVVQRMAAKIAILMQSQTAPAVPDFGALTKLIVGRLIDCGTANDDSIADAEVFVYNACRAALSAVPTPTKAESQQISPIKPVLFANDFDLKNGWSDHADTVTEAKQGYTVPLYAAPLLLDEIKDHKFNSGDKADDYHAGYQSGWNEYRDAIISAMNSAENGDVSKN